MLSRFRMRVRALLRRDAVESELDEEVRYHLDALTEEYLATGMNREAARAAARRTFGGVEQAKEECREARGTRLIEDLLRDLGQGVRALRRSPGFTTTVALCLALGIGANLTIFSLYNAVLLRPLPVANAHQLVRFSDGGSVGAAMDEKPNPGRIELYSYPLYQRLRAQSAAQQPFDGVAAQQSNFVASLVRGGADTGASLADDAAGRCVSANFFSVLGVAAHLGRMFVAEDETAPGANPVVVLSHHFWLRRLGADPSLIGAKLVINGLPYTVVGIAALGFIGTRIGDRTDFWVPVTMQESLMRFVPMLRSRAWSWLHLVGRLRSGVSLAAAEASANVTLQQFLSEDPVLEPARRRAVRIGLESAVLGLASVNQASRDLLGALLAGVGLLLLTICLNVSYLIVMRAIDRHREMCVRAALGAGRGRLVRQLLTEGLLLASIGMAGAGVVVFGARRGLMALLDDGTPFAVDLSTDRRVWGFTAALGLATAVVLGLVPAWRAARADLQDALRSSDRAIAGEGRRLLRRFLLTSQVAFSLVLLVSAGLLSASLGKLRDVDVGFGTSQVLLVDLNPRVMGLGQAQLQALHEDLLGKVAALPGVERASLSTTAVLSGGHARDNIQRPGRERLRSVQTESITPGYFETLGITLLRGRGFSAADRPLAPGVVVVNETLARRLYGRPDVLGERFRFEHFPGASHPDLEIVGVVADARTVNLRLPPNPIGYLPADQSEAPLEVLEVRAVPGVPPSTLAPAVRAAVRAAHAGLPVLRVRTMQVQLERTFLAERALAILSAVFGLASLFIVCVGLYGVVSQWALQRTQELAIRMALGETARGVRVMVLRQAFGQVLGGVLLGVPAALAATGLLRGLLFGIDARNPRIFVLAAAAMFIVAAIAAWLPARRASRLDPAQALRCE